MTEDSTHLIKHSIDFLAVVGTAASFLHLMPDIAALMAVIWYIIRFVEWYKHKHNKSVNKDS